MNSYVYSFDELAEPKLLEIGGKATNLIKLSHINEVNIPDGFCITTTAYNEMFEDNNELDLLLTQLSLVKCDDLESICPISGMIRDIIVTTKIPEKIMSEIASYHAKFGDDEAYAVRSSATAEDQPMASFAGQHDTYLNIVGIDHIIEHIRKCWASLFTERAIIYRMMNGYDHRKVSLAVVVQRLIYSDFSGVMFTADPISSNRKIVSIDASFGLGEALVSGRVNSDNYKVCDGRVTDKMIKTKNLGAFARKNGGTEDIAINEDKRNKQVLSEAQILELEILGRKIEAFFSVPQDIEWCILEGSVYILQSRPITTLYPLPENNEENRIYVSSGHMQMMTDPIRPLGMFFFNAIVNAPPSKEIGGRHYLDLTGDLSTAFRKMITMKMLEMIGDTLITNAVLEIVKDKERIKALPKEKKKVFVLENNSGALSIVFHAYKAYKKNDPDIISNIIAKEEKSIEKMKTEIQNLSGDAVFEFIAQDHDNRRTKLMPPPNAGAMTAVMLSVTSFDKKIKKWLGEDNASNTIIMSIPNSVTTKTGLALMDVADVIRDYPKIIDYLQNPCDETFFEDISKLNGGKLVCDSIKDYLDKYGMRCSGDIDITVPRWSENPTELVPMIINNIKNFEPNVSKIKYEEGKVQSEERIQELIDRLEKLPRGKQKAKKIRHMASLIRNYIGYREYPKFSYMKRYQIYKEAMLKEANILLTLGLINTLEDIYYLHYDELRAAINSKKLDYSIIIKRKKDYEYFAKLTPPRVMTSDGEIITGEYKRSDLPENALPGLSVSAGVVEGRARIVKCLKDASLEEGDILVTEFTDPSWTPAFVSIKGLITEVGGLATHGAIIAREYGLPAVVSVRDAMTLIKDGQRIRLNGSEGYVEILSDNDE